MPHERDEEMRTHLQAWQSSGLTQKQYCQQHNLKNPYVQLLQSQISEAVR